MFKRLIRRFLPGGGAGMAVRVGDPAPEFDLPDHRGGRVSSGQLGGQRYLLWFYPMADTPG